MVRRFTLKEQTTFERLYMKQKRKVMPTVTHTIVNLNSKLLTDEMESVLIAKGLNLAMSPKELPEKGMVCGVELSLKDLLVAEAEEVRGDICRLLKGTQPPQEQCHLKRKGGFICITQCCQHCSYKS